MPERAVHYFPTIRFETVPKEKICFMRSSCSDERRCHAIVRPWLNGVGKRWIYARCGYTQCAGSDFCIRHFRNAESSGEQPSFCEFESRPQQKIERVTVAGKKLLKDGKVQIAINDSVVCIHCGSSSDAEAVADYLRFVRLTTR